MIERLPVLNALRCSDCTEMVEVHHRDREDPEKYASFVELTELDHVECAQYKDAAMALHMRQFRKKKLALQRKRGAQDVQQRGTYQPHWR